VVYNRIGGIKGADGDPLAQ